MSHPFADDVAAEVGIATPIGNLDKDARAILSATTYRRLHGVVQLVERIACRGDGSMSENDVRAARRQFLDVEKAMEAGDLAALDIALGFQVF